MFPPQTLNDFDYPLPPEAIAQHPAEPRDTARLLVSRTTTIHDHHFQDLPDLLTPGDRLVLNDTKVLPARLLGKKPTGGRVEVFLLRPLTTPGEWLALTRGLKIGAAAVTLAPGLTAELLEETGEGRRVRLATDGEELAEAILRHGHMPLPPYIVSTDPQRDKHRYQTVYATHPGAVAAPTAGLHFTQALLQQLEQRGIHTTTVTLHVGLGTFQPVRENDLSRHRMHREWCCLTPQAAMEINQSRAAGHRIVAVGTTAARVLESTTDDQGVTHPFQGETDIFIRPGYHFKGVSALVTNFHLPRSTLLMLVAALIGKERMERDYAHAMAHGYRFYSYGDGSLLLPDSPT